MLIMRFGFDGYFFFSFAMFAIRSVADRARLHFLG
jgi:hypothetical protein